MVSESKPTPLLRKYWCGDVPVGNREGWRLAVKAIPLGDTVRQMGFAYFDGK